jgi:hypothetical protein
MLGLNPGNSGGKPATNSLSYATATMFIRRRRRRRKCTVIRSLEIGW